MMKAMVFQSVFHSMVRAHNAAAAAGGRLLGILEKLVFVVAAGGLVTIILVQMPRWYVLLVPGVERIRLEGSFVHVDRLEVERMIDAAVEDGFFSVDLPRLESSLRGIAWVKQVWVRRVWPRTLRIELTEYEAAVRWGSDALLDVDGRVFRGSRLRDGASLPVLYGPRGKESELLDWYRRITASLSKIGFSVKVLREDYQGSLSIMLDNGWLLRLGAERWEERLQRFRVAYMAALSKSERHDRIACLDFRYVSGFTVGWERSECYR